MTTMEEKTIEGMTLPNQTSEEAYDHGDEYAFWNTVEFEIKDITQHNQARSCQMNHPETKMACTIIWALNQIIKLFDLNLSPTDADKLGVEVATFATKFGYKFWSGWSTPTAINTVVKRWNTVGYQRFNKEQVFYVRVDHTDPKVKEALDKWHYVGFTYQLNFGTDKYWGLVDKDDYPAGYGHRTNFQRKEDVDTASKKVYTDVQLWVHDNYHGWVNEYYIKDIKKYVGRGMYPAVYLVMPTSWMKGTVEEKKQEIQETKAVNALIGMLSSTREYLDEDNKKLVSELASSLRQKYPEARKKIELKETKVAQTIVDAVSFWWKDLEAFRDKFALLAKEMREKYGVE